MSAPVMLSCAVVALVIGLPVLAAGGRLEAQHRAAGAADAAALAAADAVVGLIPDEPCAVADRVANAVGASLVSCEIGARVGEARLSVRVRTPLGNVEARARAAPEAKSMLVPGLVGANGWAWPSGARGTTQGFHDGTAIDLAVGADGLLYAPHDGIVVHAGGDGAGRPTACAARPDWWRGENHTVIIRHAYEGQTIYSSHNHIEPGSVSALGISVGDTVVAGQAVARAGMSGCTSGPHTHFTLSSWPSNAFPDLDPYLYLGAP